MKIQELYTEAFLEKYKRYEEQFQAKFSLIDDEDEIDMMELSKII